MKRESFVIRMLLCASIAGSSALAVEPWGTYQGNASHTGYVPETLNTSKFAFKWQTDFGSGASLNPVTEGEGKVYVSKQIYFNNTDSLFALSATTGQTLWSKNFGSIFSVNPPAYANGKVYVQTCDNAGDTFLRAYDATTGNFVYRSPHGAQWERYYAPTVHNGTVFIDGGGYGGMYSFDGQSGNQNWFQGLPQYDQWTPAVDNNYAYSYVGEYTPGLYVLNRNTGTQAFMIPDANFDWNGWSMNSAPVLGSKNDILAIHNSRLISFDLVNHSIRWELPRSFVGQPALSNGVIFAIDAGVLSARDELTGASLWGWEVPSGSLTGTMVVTNNLIFTRTSTTVYAVDLLTHQSVWSYPASGELALSEGILYISGADGKLTAISVPEPAAMMLLALVGALGLKPRRAAAW